MEEQDSKDIDFINNEFLLAKLQVYGFNKDALKIIRNYLKNIYQTTKIKFVICIK